MPVTAPEIFELCGIKRNDFNNWVARGLLADEQIPEAKIGVPREMTLKLSKRLALMGLLTGAGFSATDASDYSAKLLQHYETTGHLHMVGFVVTGLGQELAPIIVDAGISAAKFAAALAVSGEDAEGDDEWTDTPDIHAKTIPHRIIRIIAPGPVLAAIKERFSAT
ncbi:hypothetical protein [Oryzibacter oryziterrae]|uniref:hypothetical protein n=1 Tax=Oryzibacter oryziterrae TaxID=2766474 RepID=UPI001F2D442B|nr:hypothetical protein [Oryzibacter oryziterrae]